MTVSVKSLQKQLVAAVAMVLVAAVALSSSTYAWFVSNNKVEATTTSISAQSNSAYLVIQNAAAREVNGVSGVTGTNTDSTSAATASETPITTKLYPAQVVGAIGGESAEKLAAKFESAYASKANEATEKDATRFTIKSSGKTDGSAAAAVAEQYAIKNTFFVGTGTYDGAFEDLKVTGVAVSAKRGLDLYTVAAGTETGYSDEATTYAYLKGTTPATAADYITKTQYEALTGTSELVNAMRVLVVCGDNWVVWKNGAQVTEYETTTTTGTSNMVALSGQATGGVLADSVVKGTDAKVDVYVFYDGADANVFSDNLADLKDCGVTITFEATPVTHGA